MTAYVVMIREKTKDADAFAKYAESAPAASAGHAATPKAFYGQQEVKEGQDCEGVAILEFPDYAQAKAWYESPEYQAVMQHRLAGADYRVIIVEGM